MGILVHTVRLVRMAIEVRQSPILKILQSLRLGGWIYYPKEQYLWISDGFLDNHEIEIPEKIANLYDMKSILSVEDLPVMQRTLNTSKAKNIPFSIAFRVKNTSGKYLWLNANGNQIVNKHGELELMFGTVTEITRQREEQDRLRRSMYFLDEVWRMAKIAGWRYDVKLDTLFITNELADLVEFPEAPKQMKFREALKFYHPEDREFAKGQFIQSIKERAYFSFDTRIITKKGHKRWVKVKGDNIFNPFFTTKPPSE